MSLLETKVTTVDAFIKSLKEDLDKAIEEDDPVNIRVAKRDFSYYNFLAELYREIYINAYEIEDDQSDVDIALYSEGGTILELFEPGKGDKYSRIDIRYSPKGTYVINITLPRTTSEDILLKCVAWKLMKKSDIPERLRLLKTTRKIPEYVKEMCTHPKFSVVVHNPFS